MFRLNTLTRRAQGWQQTASRFLSTAARPGAARNIGAAVGRLFQPRRLEQTAASALGHAASRLAPREVSGQPPTPAAGRRAALASVQVNGRENALMRAGYLRAAQQIGDDSRAESAPLFARAESVPLFDRPAFAAPRPPRVGEGPSVRYDALGGVTATEELRREGRAVIYERATREGSRVTFERVRYEGGKASRVALDSGGPDGPAVRTEEKWPHAAGAPLKRPTTAELMRRANGGEGVTLSELSVRDEGDEVVVREGATDGAGRYTKTRTFGSQTDLEGIHDKLEEDKFKEGEPVATVRTQTVWQPWCGARQEETTKTYEQGHVRATAIDGHDADGNKLPRQWVLETQRGTHYRGQVFVEGNKSFVSLIEREANGLAVTETATTSYDGEDGKVEFGSRQEKIYHPDGTLRSFHRTETDARGASRVLDYKRELLRAGRGTLASEETSVSETSEYGVVSAARSSTTTLTTEEDGVQVLESEQTVEGYGQVVVSRLGEAGLSLFVNGREVGGDDLANLSPLTTQLAASAAASTAKNLSDYAGVGKKVFKLLGTGLDREEADFGARPNALARLNNRINDRYARLFTRLGAEPGELLESLKTGHTIIGGQFGMAAGALGAVSAGFQLAEAIRTEDTSAIVENGVRAGASVYDIFDSGRAVTNTVRGAAPLAPGQRAAEQTARALSRVPGLSKSAKFAAASRVGLVAKYTGPVGNVLGAGLSGLDIYQGIRDHDGAAIAKGGLGLGAAVATGAAIGVWGGWVGSAVGVGAGLVAYGGSKAIDEITDKEHDIADVKI
jgi:hypothetical protein